jgi:hypothetical protein
MTCYSTTKKVKAGDIEIYRRSNTLSQVYVTLDTVPRTKMRQISISSTKVHVQMLDVGVGGQLLSL